MFKTLINMTMVMMVLVLFTKLFVAVEYILNAMLLHDLVRVIWVMLWVPMVYCATIYISQFLLI